MNKPLIFGFLVLATTLEVSGDAVIRHGLHSSSTPWRVVLFAAGALLLFGYGLFLNIAPVEFGKVVGVYIATLFVVWQIVNFAVFRRVPDLPIVAGGALIVAGGCVVTLWTR